jgi:hypothetical protein
MTKLFDPTDPDLLTILQAIHEQAAQIIPSERHEWLATVRTELFQISLDTIRQLPKQGKQLARSHGFLTQRAV